MFFHYFVIISPWKKDGAFHLNKLEFPSPEDALCQVWLKLAQWFWRRWKMWKVYDNDDDIDDNDGQRTNFDQKSFLEPRLRWAKKGRNCSALTVVRVFNQIFLRLNLRFGKKHHLLIIQIGFISAQMDFLLICINASLYEWQDRQGPVTILLTTCTKVFCHSVKILKPCYKRIL